MARWWTVLRHNVNGEGFQAYYVDLVGHAPSPMPVSAIGPMHYIAPEAGRTFPSDFDADVAQWYAQVDGEATGLPCDPTYTRIAKPMAATQLEAKQARAAMLALRAEMIRRGPPVPLPPPITKKNEEK